MDYKQFFVENIAMHCYYKAKNKDSAILLAILCRKYNKSMMMQQRLQLFSVLLHDYYLSQQKKAY